MDLRTERNSWHNQFQIEPLHSTTLEAYRENRNSNYWRISREVEKLCEYILFLESKTKDSSLSVVGWALVNDLSVLTSNPAVCAEWHHQGHNVKAVYYKAED